MTYQQIKAIEAKNKQRILSVNPSITEDSGIYILTREEGGFKFGYVGQAKHLLTRLAQHLSGYQHIGLSIKKHGLYNEQNPTGWKIEFVYCAQEDLDKTEQYYIYDYALAGYQMRNKTAGGQGEGKHGIADNRPAKGYHDGLKQGYENARREVKHLFDLHLKAVIKANKSNKIQEKALLKFYDFIGETDNLNG